MKTLSNLGCVLLGLALPAIAYGDVFTADPDSFPSGTDISTAFPGLGLSLYDSPGDSGHAPLGVAIYAIETLIPISGNKIFAFDTVDGLSPIFVSGLEDLMATFATPMAFVRLDFITTESYDPGRLQAYDSLGNLLETAETPGLAGYGEVETATILRQQADIAFVLAGGRESQGVFLDTLQYSSVPEPSSIGLAAVGLALFTAGARLRRRRAV